MKFSTDLELRGTHQSVSLMLRNPLYYARRWQTLDPQAKVDFNDQNTSLAVVSSLEIDASTVRTLSNFLDSAMAMKVTEVWNYDASGLVESGTLSVSVAGVPVKASLQAVIIADDSQPLTIARLQGEVNCSVPLLGSGIERVIVKHADQVARQQATASCEFLS